MNSIEEVLKNKFKIRNHSLFEDICKSFCDEHLALHKSNTQLYNQIFHESRINTLITLMGLIFSDKVTSMTDFYRICSERSYSSKTKALNLIDFLYYSKRLSFIKGQDRRKKTPILTEKGFSVLSDINKAMYLPLKIFDENLKLDELISPGALKRFYTNIILLNPEDKEWFDIPDYTMDAFSKSSGMLFMLRVYQEIKTNKLKIESLIRGSYFRNLSMDFDISISQVNILLQVFVKGKGFTKFGSAYIINNNYLSDVENFISLYLANVYFFLKK